MQHFINPLQLSALNPITSHYTHTHTDGGQWGDKQPINSQSPANDNEIHIYNIAETSHVFKKNNSQSPPRSDFPSFLLAMFNDFSCHTSAADKTGGRDRYN